MGEVECCLQWRSVRAREGGIVIRCGAIWTGCKTHILFLNRKFQNEHYLLVLFKVIVITKAILLQKTGTHIPVEQASLKGKMGRTEYDIFDDQLNPRIWT